MKIITITFLSVFFFGFISLHAQAKAGQPVSPKILLVLDITVHDTAMYEQYREAVEPLIRKFGGSYMVRSGNLAYDKDPDRRVTPAEGGWNPDRFIITQWNSIEQFQTFATSPEYRAIAQLREKSATTRSLIVRTYNQ